MRNDVAALAALLLSPLKKEQAAYGRIWRSLFEDAIAGGEIPPEFDVRTARMLMLGAMNWAAEWWNPRRGSLDAVVRTAQSLVRHGLGPVPAAPLVRLGAAARLRVGAAGHRP